MFERFAAGTDTGLALAALAALLLLLFLIIRRKWSAFLALIFVSVSLACVSGIPLDKIPAVIEEGAGKTLGHVALIVALGAMIGQMVDRSGGAEAFANALIGRFGSKRLVLALAMAGFVIGIPVFFEVGVIILMPVADGVAKKAGHRLITLALPMCGALLIVHALLPPHPGPIAVASLLSADLGRVLEWGLPIALVTTILAVLAYRYVLAGAYYTSGSVKGAGIAPTAVAGASTYTGPGLAPMSVSIVVTTILFPTALILIGSSAAVAFPTPSTLRHVLMLFGSPFVALALDVILCGWFLRYKFGWSRPEVSGVIGAAIPAVAMVILITGAGGAFAGVLLDSGIGSAISKLMRASGLPLLAMSYLLTLLLRAVQGPATVALITTAGILSPAISEAALSANKLALLCLAMGAGGISLSHVNDPGFWFVTRLVGLSVKEGLRSWTTLTFVASLIAFGTIVVCWTVTP